MTYRKYRTTRRGARVVTFVAFLGMVLVGLEAGARAQQTTAEPAAKTIAPGVTVSGLDLSGLTARQAEKALETFASRPVELTYRGRSWRYAPETLGADSQVDGAVHAALAAPEGATLRLGVTVDERHLRLWFRDFAAGFDQKRRDARIVLRGLRPHLIAAQAGRRLYRWGSRTRIASELLAHDRGPVALQGQVMQPRVVRRDVGPAIVIRRASNRLFYYRGVGENGMRTKRRFKIATGAAAYPTPLGNFKLVDKQENPWWYPPDSDWAAGAKPIPPGPGNPLGTRWMGLSEPLIGIHGTPDAASIGYSASHGCIRMLVPEAEWLFERVPEGTPVYILDA